MRLIGRTISFGRSKPPESYLDLFSDSSSCTPSSSLQESRARRLLANALQLRCVGREHLAHLEVAPVALLASESIALAVLVLVAQTLKSTRELACSILSSFAVWQIQNHEDEGNDDCRTYDREIEPQRDSRNQRGASEGRNPGR